MRYDGPSDGRGPHQSFREVVGSGAHLRPLLHHLGVDVRVLGARATRRIERQQARDAMRMLERGLGLGVVAAACGIVNSKHLERRLIDENFNGLRHDARDGAHRVADRRMRRDRERRA